MVFGEPGLVYAGGQHVIGPRNATVVDLAGHLAPAMLTWDITVPGFAARYVRVQWADHGTPALTADDWQALARALRSARAPVLVGCMGGHGRTGTALAILGHFLGAYPTATTDPIAHVRHFYCSEAVETSGQVDYIKAMTGRATECKGSLGSGMSGAMSLCPVKVCNDWCNLDAGHAGAHDTRKRHVLIAAGLCGEKPKGKGKGKSSLKPLYTSSSAYQASQAFLDAQPYNVKAATTENLSTAGPVTFCRKTTECLARSGHAGPCVNVVGDSIIGGK